MDPHEAEVKNPYACVSIPRAQLRPDFGRAEPDPDPRPRPAEPLCGPGEAKGGPGAQEPQSRPGNPYAGLKRPAGCPEPPYATVPPRGPGDDIAHNCCCCPCCSCCHCPPCCRCHPCCCVVS
ncbi:cysteine-rich tail protein 1 [Ornithorhynchus anatinus]|uniref:Cysteine rich tail 1 n=1 Tax=Ornithorhynchus anatinus TaxID=9258 RepID=A0A6I8NHJ3_ORNAN|nr:cysteine-rich tail protein 1 [Ornithorhynchus anatinus]